MFPVRTNCKCKWSRFVKNGERSEKPHCLNIQCTGCLLNTFLIMWMSHSISKVWRQSWDGKSNYVPGSSCQRYLYSGMTWMYSLTSVWLCSVTHTYPSYNGCLWQEKNFTHTEDKWAAALSFHPLKENATRRNFFQVPLTSLLLPGVHLLPSDLVSFLVLGVYPLHPFHHYYRGLRVSSSYIHNCTTESRPQNVPHSVPRIHYPFLNSCLLNSCWINFSFWFLNGNMHMVSRRILCVHRVQLNSLLLVGTSPCLLNTLQGNFMALSSGKASGTNTNYYFFSLGGSLSWTTNCTTYEHSLCIECSQGIIWRWFAFKNLSE